MLVVTNTNWMNKNYNFAIPATEMDKLELITLVSSVGLTLVLLAVCVASVIRYSNP